MAQVVVSASILFELYRFLARELGAEQIGAWSLVLASASVARLAEFGLGGGIVKFVAGDLGAGERARAASTIGVAACAMGLIFAAACGVAFVALPPLLSNLIPDKGVLTGAFELIPWALAGLWCASVAGVFASALDASQRTGLRASVMVGGALFQLLAAYLVVPIWGLQGLGVAYFMQAALTLFASLGIVRWILAEPFRNWGRIDSRRFVELLRYGANLQAATLGQLLFDPVTKAFMARYGGLVATGHYEMASKAVTQARAVIVAGYQALVPYLATRAGDKGINADDLRSTYIASYRFLFVFGTPYFVVVGALIPVLLTSWLGIHSPEFIAVGFICLAGWYGNTLTVPAYVHCLALGEVRWIMLSHLAMGVLNLALSYLGGMIAGALGVVSGAMLALWLGSVLVPLALHYTYDIPGRYLFETASIPLAAACGGGLTLAIWVGLSGYSSALALALAASVTGACGLVVLLHPFAREVFAQIQSRTRK